MPAQPDGGLVYRGYRWRERQITWQFVFTADAATGLGLEPADLQQIGLHCVVTEYEATGKLILGKPAAPDPANGLSMGACTSRGRIKGGSRVTSKTVGDSVSVFVAFTRRTYRRAHRHRKNVWVTQDPKDYARSSSGRVGN